MANPLSPPNTASEMALLADRCVQCGLCLPHCPTYQLDRSETESPRGRIAYMKALALGQINATRIGDAHLDHCLGCLRCESACPANVAYGDLLGLARQQQYLRTRPFRQNLLNQLLVRPGLMNIAGMLGRTSGYLPALPQGDTRHRPNSFAAGKKIAVFAGCIAGSYEAGTRLNLQRILGTLGFSVDAANGQACCGSAARHLGDTARASELARVNRTAFAASTTVLSLATGCHDQLSCSLQSQNKVVDALDFILQHAADLKFESSGKTIILHIPCSQSTMVKSLQATRQLLSMIPGLEITELPDKGCCGAAGTHMLTEPERAKKMRAPLLAQVHASKATELLSANIGCRLHIANGLKIPVRHPIDFLAEHLA